MASGVDLPLTGGCGCGAVRFEIDVPIARAVYCHCTRCQRRTGTGASASGYVAPGSVRVVRGQEHLRGWAPEGGLEKVFCGGCGSALFAGDPESAEVRAVRLGALDGDPGVRPGAHQFVAYAPLWDAIPTMGCRGSPSACPAE